MQTISISLPEDLKSFVVTQVVEGSYSSGSEYVRDLLRREWDRVRLRDQILEGSASPLSETPMDAEYFEKRRKRMIDAKVN